MQLTAMTELDAINLMLAVIGEAPVSTLVTPGLSEASLATQTLKEVAMEVMERGWGFNTEDDVTFALTSDGYIIIPDTILRVDTIDETYSVTQRGNRLYNKTDKTYVWLECPTLKVTYFLDWSDLPHAARYYIAIRAARKFQSRWVSAEVLEKLSEDDEYQALAALQDMDTDVEDYNIITGNPFIASIVVR